MATTKSTSGAKSQALSSIAKSAAKSALSSLANGGTKTAKETPAATASLKDSLTGIALQTAISQFTTKAASGSDASALDIASVVTKLTNLFAAKNVNYASIANVIAQVFNAGFKQGKKNKA